MASVRAIVVGPLIILETLMAQTASAIAVFGEHQKADPA
jgi:hypothetical protein